ncbi:hypothetical protein ACTJKJ_17540 [Roseateles sp. 22389]|uniref:hypothetical protein n=1 Tax=Roseateles sp. 22389 TaxID=3453916 RepID=UPI0026095EF5|nr:hypothetical protein [uncultured Roseateles sp.]
MLQVRFSIEHGLENYSIAPVPAPCTPDQVLRMEVRFAGLPALVATWLRIHLKTGRPNQFRIAALLLLILAIVGGAHYLALSPHLAAASWSTQADAASGATAQAPTAMATATATVTSMATVTATVMATPTAAAPSASHGAAAVLQHLLMIWTPLAVAIAAMMARLARPNLTDIYVVALRPHEPFPTMEYFLARSRDKQVYAIRFLSESTRDRFFGHFADGPRRARLSQSSINVTHAHIGPFAPTGLAAAMSGYWSLVRLSIGLMVEENASSNTRAMAFTYKQHEWLFIGYLMLLGAAALLVALGVTPGDQTFQFPVLMAGLGVCWAAAFLLLNRGLSDHLTEWERRTATAPFMGCPVFRYSERDQASGRWELVDLRQMEAPIHRMGLPGDKVLEIALGVMLIIYLTLLQLIK